MSWSKRVADGGVAPAFEEIPQNFSKEGADCLTGPARQRSYVAEPRAECTTRAETATPNSER